MPAARERMEDPVVRELCRYPGEMLHHLMDYEHPPQKKLDAFADAVRALYQRHGHRGINGHVAFSRKIPSMIRRRNAASFAKAMQYAVRDIGHAQELLVIKRLIFG